MELHQVASKLEGELLMHKSSSNVDQLSQELRLRTKAIKALVGLLLLAIFTPGLFYVVFVLALGMLGPFYYLEMEPYKHQIDEVSYVLPISFLPSPKIPWAKQETDCNKRREPSS